MRTLRAILAGALTLVSAALLAAWLVPGMLDWDQYRENIAILASAVLGRPVTIDGRVTLTLLPEPVLTASDVNVAGRDGSATVRARELRLRVALMPLLSGTVAAREVVLRQPEIRIPWPLAPGALSFHRPPWLGAVSARIERGTLSIGDVHFSDIDAALAVGGDGGAAASGTAVRDGRGWRFTARATGVGADDVEGLDLTLDGLGTIQGLGAVFSGQLDGDGTLSGHIAARGPDLSQLLPAPAVAFHAAGRLTLAAGLAAADDLALEIGGSPVHGAVTLRLAPEPRLDLALAASRLDLDAWLPVLLRQSSLPCVVGLDLSAEAVQLAGGMLRGLRAAFDFSPNGQVVVREAAAVLPGEASLHLDGHIGHEAGRPRFAGRARLSAPDLRTTLRWLEGPSLDGRGQEARGLKLLAGLPPDVLRSAELTAGLTADPDRLALHDLRGQLDGNSIGGEFAIGLGQRVAIAASLAITPLPLESWLGNLLVPLGEIADRLGRFDADLQVTATQASWHGTALQGLAMDLAAVGGRLTVRRVAFAAEGVRAELSGSLGEGGRVTDARLELTTKTGEPLAGLLPAAWRTPSLWQGPCHVEVRAAGPPQALTMQIGLDLADGRLEAQPVIDLAARSWSGPVTLRHPGAPRLLMLMGFPDSGWLGDGSLSVVAQMTGSPGRVAIDKFDLGAAALHAGGQLLVESGAGAVPRISGRVGAETLPLPLPWLRSSEPLDLAWLRGWRLSLQLDAAHVVDGSTPLLEGASASLMLADGILRVEHLGGTLGGTLGGGRLAGALRLDAVAEPPVASFRAALGGASLAEPPTGLPLDLASGLVDGSVDLTAIGHSPAALLATMGGTVRLLVRDGTLTGFDLAAAGAALARLPEDGIAQDGALVQALSGGATGFDRLDAAVTVRGGRVVLDDVTMTGPSGRAALSGTVDVAGSAIDLRAALHPVLANAPELDVRISGPWASARRIIGLTDVPRWRAVQAAK